MLDVQWRRHRRALHVMPRTWFKRLLGPTQHGCCEWGGQLLIELPSWVSRRRAAALPGMRSIVCRLQRWWHQGVHKLRGQHMLEARRLP